MSPRPTATLARGIALAGLLLPAAGRAAQIHVPKDYPTIQQAIDAAAPGDEIVVAPGTYSEVLTIPGKTDLTLRGKKAKKVVVDAAGAVDPVLSIGGSSTGVTVERMTLRHGAGNGVEISLADGVTILDCRIEDVGGTGVLVGLAGGVELRGTLVRATGLFGVTSVADGLVVRDCRIEKCGDAGARLFGSQVSFLDNVLVATGGAGIEAGVLGLSLRTALLAGNRIEETAGPGIEIGPGADGCLVGDNDVRSPAGAGLRAADGAANVWLSGNKVKNADGSGIEIAADAVTAFDNVLKKNAQQSGASLLVAAGAESGLFFENRSKKSAAHGFSVLGSGHTFVDNVALKSAAMDLFDPNPAGTNLYFGNVFGTQGP